MVGTIEVRAVCGIPASGKSTWIAREIERLEEEKYTTAVISRDVVRFGMLKDSDEYFAHENEVFDEFIRQINEAIELGINYVFVDQTSISKGSRAKLLSRLKPTFDTVLALEVFNCPFDVCMERNAKREGRARVPDTAMQSMNRGFAPPTPYEFRNYNYGFANVVIRNHTGVD